MPQVHRGDSAPKNTLNRDLPSAAAKVLLNT